MGNALVPPGFKWQLKFGFFTAENGKVFEMDPRFPGFYLDPKNLFFLPTWREMLLLFIPNLSSLPEYLPVHV
eukprot:g52186.t1